jgi:hypothetical protein
MFVKAVVDIAELSDAATVSVPAPAPELPATESDIELSLEVDSVWMPPIDAGSEVGKRANSPDVMV